MKDFFTFNLGQVVSLITVSILLMTFHRSNKKRIENDAAEKQEAKGKIDTVHHWVTCNAPDMAEIKIKVDLMYNTWIANASLGFKTGKHNE